METKMQKQTRWFIQVPKGEKMWFRTLADAEKFAAGYRSELLQRELGTSKDVKIESIEVERFAE